MGHAYKNLAGIRDLALAEALSTSPNNVAATLAPAGRFADAREWDQSALRDFEACENADREVIETLKLLEEIESALRATSPPS